MQVSIDEVIPYLKARLNEFSSRPDLHRHSIKVYERLLSVAEHRPGDYMDEAGDMFQVMKAEQLDRAENMLNLYTRLEMPGGINAYSRILEAVKNSNDYTDINTTVARARQDANPLISADAAVKDALEEMLAALFMFRVSIQKEKKNRADELKRAWQKLKVLDPDVSWDKICGHAAYRRCLYYDDERLKIMGSWLEEVLS